MNILNKSCTNCKYRKKVKQLKDNDWTWHNICIFLIHEKDGWGLYLDNISDKYSLCECWEKQE